MDVSAQELSQRLSQGDGLILLDVRQPHEREYCKIVAPSANDLHIPMAEVPARVEEIRGAAGSNPVYVYCHHGVRSRMVAEWLASQGIAIVYNLAGGIDVWSRVIDSSVPRY